MKTDRLTFTALLIGAALALCARTVSAQSTLFNIPTTDVVDKARVYFELDYLAQLPKPEDLLDGPSADRLHAIVSRLVVGLGGNVEVGANLATYHLGDTENVSVQPNLKWRFLHTDHGLAAAAGAILYVPINHREVADTLGLVYANLSLKIDHPYGFRLHLGPYGVVGASETFAGPEAGVLAGYEQPLHSKVTVVADWLSGKNGFGYFTPGISFSIPKGAINIGYSFGNDSFADDNATRNRLLFIYWGITSDPS